MLGNGCLGEKTILSHGIFCNLEEAWVTLRADEGFMELKEDCLEDACGHL